jgi:hypothetical protein
MDGNVNFILDIASRVSISQSAFGLYIARLIHAICSQSIANLDTQKVASATTYLNLGDLTTPSNCN